MRTSNLANESIRESNAGHVWEEQLSGALGTVLVNRFQTFRVRATGATTVTIGGVLAMTMSAGEIEYFNAGHGSPSVDTTILNGGSNPSGTQTLTVPVVIAGAAAFVQTARDNKRLV
jgi:hypothetical protein